MAQELPQALQVAQESLLRNPCFRATVIDDQGVEHDISDDVISCELEFTQASEANKATLKVENKNAKYDKFKDYIPTGTLKLDINNNKVVEKVAFSDNQKMIGLGCNNGDVEVYSFPEGNNILTHSHHTETITSVVFSHDHEKVLTASEDSTIKVINILDGSIVLDVDLRLAGVDFNANNDYLTVNSAHYSPDGSKIILSLNASESDVPTILVLDSTTGEVINNYDGCGTETKEAKYSNDGAMVLGVGVDKTAKIWDVETGELLITFSDHSATVWTCDFSSDGTKAATGDFDGTLRVWDVTDGSIISTVSQNDSIYSADFSNDNTRVISNTYTETVIISDVYSGVITYEFEEQLGSLLDCSLSPDDFYIASVGNDGSIKVWKSGLKLEITVGSIFEENNKIIIEKGNNDNYLPAGVFLIRKTSASKYQRGEKEILTAKCFDKTKNLLKRKVTTDLYEDMEFNEIIEDIALNYAGLTSSEVNLTGASRAIEKVQFVDEYMFDAMDMCGQANAENVGFDESGVLVNTPINTSTVASWTYENADFIKWYEPSWNDDEVANVIKVLGRNVKSFEKILQDEELLVGPVELYCPTGEDGISRTYEYQKSEEIRVVPSTWEDLSVVSKTKTKTKLYLHNSSHKLSDEGPVEIKIYGRPVGNAVPNVLRAIASNQELINKYGIVEEKIDNPLIQSKEIAQFLADETLQKKIWSRNKMTLEVPSNRSHQVGDVIKAYHPRYDLMLKLYIHTIKENYQRGEKDVMKLETYLIGVV